MTLDRTKRAPPLLALLGLLAFAVLAVRFSPNWLPFCHLVNKAAPKTASPAEAQAIKQAVFQAPSVLRGHYVLQQTQDLGVEIAEPNHKIVRWRLLMPAVGHVLKLPGWVVLGLAHVGCLALAFALVAIAHRGATSSEGRPFEALCFGLIAGASAPFLPRWACWGTTIPGWRWLCSP